MNTDIETEQSPEPYEGDDAENFEREQVARDIALGEGSPDEEVEDEGLSDDVDPDESEDEGGVAGDFDDDGPSRMMGRDEFAVPGGRSALRAATPTNPRDCPCPTCQRPNVLTRRDVELGYQCDTCADAAEGSGP
jgi:hypothetical protein